MSDQRKYYYTVHDILGSVYRKTHTTNALRFEINASNLSTSGKES